MHYPPMFSLIGIFILVYKELKNTEGEQHATAQQKRTRTLIPRSSRCWSTACSPPRP